MTKTEEYCEVMQAYLDGETIEFKTKNSSWLGGWFAFNRGDSTKEPFWDFTRYEYRVVETPDEIDWSHVHPEYNYMARDKSGDVFIYNELPIIDDSFDLDGWKVDYDNGGTCFIVRTNNANGFASYKQGTVDWKDSLVTRPK